MTLFLGDSVCLIGGGSHVQKGYITSSRYIAQCNNQATKNSYPVDFLYHMGYASPEPMRKVSSLLLMINDKAAYTEAWCRTAGYLKSYTFSCTRPSLGHDHFAQTLYNEVGPPLIGAVALAHLITLPLKLIHITGMDLYKDYWVDGRPHEMNGGLGKGKVNLWKNARWFKRVIQYDKRIMIDDVFRDALDRVPDGNP